MDVSDLDYDLPESLIAQSPPASRDGARMLLLEGASLTHRQVCEFGALLPPRSVLVLNDTRVIRARLRGKKESGGKVELLLLEPVDGSAKTWRAMGKASKPLRVDARILFEEGEAKIEQKQGAVLTLRFDREVLPLLERFGEMPLPPYIARGATDDDDERYQTVFAREPGAVAAPTAGLHLTKTALAEIEAAGHDIAHVTLHVGPGTFRPIKAHNLDDHDMHSERYEVSSDAARVINEAKRQGRPIVAVGTTVVRTLEAAAREGQVRAGSAETELFIQPGFRFQIIDALLTNFHLPRSTLIALVMAFAGTEETRRAYREAVSEKYRFYSYGDAMFIRRNP